MGSVLVAGEDVLSAVWFHNGTQVCTVSFHNFQTPYNINCKYSIKLKQRGCTIDYCIVPVRVMSH